MADTTTITIRIPIAAKTQLDRLAELTQRSRSYLAAEALQQYLAYEIEVVEGILEGIEDMKAGRVVPHDEAMAELREIIDKAAARQRKSA